VTCSANGHSPGTAGLADHPDSLARQVLALMGGLEDQWLRDLAAVNLVREWDRAMDTVITSLTAR
jgi:hypothetical protein